MTIEKGGPRLETAALASTVRSSVLEPGDAGWDEARRVWNARFDARPAAIVRPTGVGDIVAAVDFARERDILLAVRGGGHSYAGHGTCDGVTDSYVTPLRSPYSIISVSVATCWW